MSRQLRKYMPAVVLVVRTSTLLESMLRKPKTP
jgi:hypothetical protein